jgi:uncharacterized protein (DUF58 family)
MTPTVRAAALLAVIALSALFVSPALTIAAAAALVGAAAADAASVRMAPTVKRRLPSLLARGVPAPFALELTEERAGRLRVRQPVPPDVRIQPSEGDRYLRSEIVARRRGHHELEPAAVRVEGPLGLAAWYHRAEEPASVRVYPDMPAAYRLALAVRRGRHGGTGRRMRGPLGLGTDFESIRDYLPDDDIRQVNWRATARLGRPMSNQYRVEQDRDVICLVDLGRLMSSPLADRTRLDAAVDAAVAIGAVADELDDRCGIIAFDDDVRRRLNPRRRGGKDLAAALYDVEPSRVDGDYELAFRAVGTSKRAFVVVFTDLLEETAARPLVDAMPVLTQRHHVAVASASDTDLDAFVAMDPARPIDVYRASVARNVLDTRARVTGTLRRTGADVIEAPPQRLAAACVQVYLRAKARARL